MESIKVATENILKSYGIARSAYHGGNFIGTHCRLLLDSCDEIVTRVAKVSVEKKRKDISFSDEDISERCDEYRKLIRCLDATFSSLNIYSPNESEIQDLDSRISDTLGRWTQLGISVTTKAHLLVHCKEQITDLKDIASKKEEHVERYHQVHLNGSSIREFDKRHNSQLKLEKIGSDSKVQAKVEETYRASKRRRTSENPTKKVQYKLEQIKIKEEKRSKYGY